MEPAVLSDLVDNPELEALRIQAAAVVAQQAALGEEEQRLQQRRTGLERQEEQLAHHLQEKRRSLMELRDQIKSEREAFKQEQAEEQCKLDALRQEAEQAHADADADRREADKERTRFVALRKRLKQRWEQHFAEHESELARRTRDLDAVAATLGRERSALVDQRVRYNGEMELGRRQLEEASQELALSQQEWEVCLNREKAEYEDRNRKLNAREHDLADRERILTSRQLAWEQGKSQREKEAQGLDARVYNQRRKLRALEKKPDTSRQPHEEPSVARLQPRFEAPPDLQQLAGSLADQRVHLIEQWQTMLELQDHWQRQREAILAELEESGSRLTGREQQLREQEEHLAARQIQLERRQEVLAQMHCAVEGRQARLTAASVECEAERAKLLAEAKRCEESAATRIKHVESVCRRSAKQYRAQVEKLAESQRLCEETRKQYVVLWEECRGRTASLLREQQLLSSEALALEKLRHEILGKSDNVPAAERRFDKLRRQSQALADRAERALERERQALRAESRRLDERGRVVEQDDATLVEWRRKLAARQKQWLQRTLELQESERTQQQEIERLLAQHNQDEKRLHDLREELERVARLLMDEPATQAA